MVGIGLPGLTLGQMCRFLKSTGPSSEKKKKKKKKTTKRTISNLRWTNTNFFTSFDHQIGEKTEVNFDRILATLPRYFYFNRTAKCIKYKETFELTPMTLWQITEAKASTHHLSSSSNAAVKTCTGQRLGDPVISNASPLLAHFFD